MPKCPDALKEELAEKISRYTSAGWWIPATVRQAVPMLCILKKNGKLHMVFDLHMQNENMEKDISPFLDQDTIRHDVVRATYRSKLDMSEAYEQIRVCNKDIPKMDGLCYHIWHICEPSNATRGLKHPLDFPEVNVLCVPRFYHEICPCLPG